MKFLRKARLRAGFRAYEDDEEEYWYADVNMIGMIMDLMPVEDEKPRRGFFRRRREVAQPVVTKPTFGFGVVLDEPEE